MTEENTDKMFERVGQRIYPQSKLLRAWKLQGGVSAQVTALEIERVDGQRQKLVVRQHGDVDLKYNPHIAADEFKVLQFLRSAELAVPEAYYLDQSGEIFPEPYIVIEYIEGRPEFIFSHISDFIPHFAEQLARIHQVDDVHMALPFLPEQAKRYVEKVKTRPINTDESLDEGYIRDVLEAVGPLVARNTAVLLHGDYWPGNILWKDGKLAAVIDWEDAALGDPLADLANSRLEVLWAFGADAMQRFTHQYQSMTAIDCTDLPYWDLYAALRPAFQIGAWAKDEQVERAMREGHKWFITQAFAKLSVQGRT